jgi:UDP-N-acetylmuramate--alanine ligase
LNLPIQFTLETIKNIHVIGISGFGMSAIARILLEQGYHISGSDQNLSPLSADLRKDGATVHIGHQAENIQGTDLILASSAIPDDNIELRTARENGIPILHRREAMGFITQNYRTLAVAGTHGKTTTTALLTHILISAGLDPTYIVGGVMNNTGKNATVGKSDLFVIEADEYGEMFLGLTPAMAILTNIEYDHPDVFPTFEAMLATFEKFVDRLGDSGTLVACLNNIATVRLAGKRNSQHKPLLTYGVDNHRAQWQAHNIAPARLQGTQFDLHHEEKQVATAYLNLAGKHNVENALGAIAIAHSLGISFETITHALETFQGTGRRSEVMGHQAGIIVVSDYAHHPTAIQVTLAAWKAHPQIKRLWAIWQPHTYNRLRALSEEFIRAFSDAHQVLVTDVYSVREVATLGLSSPELAAMIAQHSHVETRYSGNLENTAQLLSQEVQDGDGVVILSAGDAPLVGRLLLQQLEAKRRHD